MKEHFFDRNDQLTMDGCLLLVVGSPMLLLVLFFFWVYSSNHFHGV